MPSPPEFCAVLGSSVPKLVLTMMSGSPSPTATSFTARMGCRGDRGHIRARRDRFWRAGCPAPRRDPACRSDTTHLRRHHAGNIRGHRRASRGKGGGHPAQLNYGDCFAYSLARFLDEPLLFVGNDFSHTDITPAL